LCDETFQVESKNEEIWSLFIKQKWRNLKSIYKHEKILDGWVECDNKVFHPGMLTNQQLTCPNSTVNMTIKCVWGTAKSYLSLHKN
jgi:hypothetical protein